MKRICTIELTSCANCPHNTDDSHDVEAWFSEDRCELYKFKFLNKDYSIPDWCPLPKAKV